MNLQDFQEVFLNKNRSGSFESLESGNYVVDQHDVDEIWVERTRHLNYWNLKKNRSSLLAFETCG